MVWGAFLELSTCRPAGMSLGPIPWTAMRDYAHGSGIVDVEQFCALVRAIDVDWLSAKRRRDD